MRTIISIGLLFAVGAACFAQNNYEIDRLIRGNLNRNIKAIQEATADLDEVERLEIYNRYQRSKLLWIGALAPYGIGNFIQKDPGWGAMVLAGEVIGTGVVFVGAMMFMLPIYSFFGMFTKEGQQSIMMGPYVMLAGSVIIGVAQLAGVIRVFTHVPAYNKKLRKALQLDTVTVSVEPEVNVTGHGVGLTLASVTF